MKAKKSSDFGAQMSKTSPLPDASQVTQGVTASEEHLTELTKQINEIRRLRREFEKSNSDEGTSAAVKALNEKKKIEIQKQMALEKKMKSTLYHPNLEYILGEVVHSPYMTKPLDKYPEKTFTLVHELREYKRQGIKYKDLPKEKVPYSVEEIKKTFVNDIMHFKPNYSAVERTRAKSPPKDLEGDFTFGDRPTTAIQGTKRYKSDVLLAAEARGGPAKFRKQLAEMRRSQSSQDYDSSSRVNSSMSHERGRSSSAHDRQSNTMSKSASMPFFVKNPESKVQEVKQIEIDGEVIEEEAIDATIIINPIVDSADDAYDSKYDDDRDFESIPISAFGNASCLPGMIPVNGEVNVYDNDDFEMDVQEEAEGVIQTVETNTVQDAVQEQAVVQIVEMNAAQEPVQCQNAVEKSDNDYNDAFEADDSFFNESVELDNVSLQSDVLSVQSAASNAAADLVHNAVSASRNTVSKLYQSPPKLPEAAVIDSDTDSISSMAKSIVESSVNTSKEVVVKSRSSTPLREKDTRPSSSQSINDLAKSMIDSSITSVSRKISSPLPAKRVEAREKDARPSSSQSINDLAKSMIDSSITSVSRKITSPLPAKRVDDDEISVTTQTSFVSIKDEAEQFCTNVMGQVRQKQKK